MQFELRSGRAYRALAVLSSSLLLVFGTVARAQTPGDQAGVFASGSVRYLFRICSTCPEPTGVLDSGSDGRLGSNGPAIVGGLGARGEGEATFAARALISSPDAVPELRADARAFPGIGTHEGFSEPGFYDFNAVALATGRQFYTYTGDTTQTYTMSYTVSGFAGSTLPSPTPEDESLISVSSGMTLFDNEQSGELPLGHVVDIDRVSVNGSAHTFRQSGSVSITVDPGDSYYLVAFLSAQVSIGGQGIADAGRTLTIAFTAGDTTQLVPLLSVSPVPEPATYAQLGLGLMLIGLMLRRRRRA